MANQDILVELTTVDIVQLSKFYSQRQDEAPHVFSYLQNTLAWTEKTPYNELINVFVPAGSAWQNSGTFVSIGHFPWKMIVTFTTQDSGEELYNALVRTERLEFEKYPYLYYALHEKHLPIIDRAMTARGMSVVSDDRTDLWRLKQDIAIDMAPRFPMEYMMLPLEISNAELVNDLWPHKTENSIIYVRKLIEFNGGWGLFTKNDHELVAWILKSQLGQLALLQVVEAHQRKGLAQALIHALSKDIAIEGFDALATILQSNVASQALFEKSGFTKEFMCTFIQYK